LIEWHLSNGKNNAKDLIERGLQVLSTGNEITGNKAGKVDSKIAKIADLLIDRILNDQKIKIKIESVSNDSQGVIIDKNSLVKNNDMSKVTSDFLIGKKLPLAGDVGGVANPDPTVDLIPYKCGYVNRKTGAKECKSIGGYRYC
jgi:hypothetical protein